MSKAAPIVPVTPTAVAAIARRATDKRLFDGGESLLDDDTMRANWAVPWSDLMMIMFVLFAALLAAQTFRAQAEKGKLRPPDTLDARPQLINRIKIINLDEPAPMTVPEIVKQEVSVPDLPPGSPVSQAPEELATINVLASSQEAVRASSLQDVEIAVLEDESVRVSVQGPMFFAQGKADLRPEVMKFLDRLAQIIKQTPYDIRIVGHTDDRAIKTAAFPTNWELSLVRASHVARYLIDSGGIDPSRFMVVGRGEYKPLTANTDEKARALNRRVEIIITRDIGKTKGKEHQ